MENQFDVLHLKLVLVCNIILITLDSRIPHFGTMMYSSWIYRTIVDSYFCHVAIYLQSSVYYTIGYHSPACLRLFLVTSHCILVILFSCLFKALFNNLVILFIYRATFTFFFNFLLTLVNCIYVVCVCVFVCILVCLCFRDYFKI